MQPDLPVLTWPKGQGLLNAYNSPIHPSTLDMVFSDLVRAHLDPLLKSEYEKFVVEVESNVKRVSIQDLQGENDDDALQTLPRTRFVKC